MAKYSLIIATLHRPVDLEKALSSFCVQTYKDFEVIIVDQSTDSETQRVVESFKDRLQIVYAKSTRLGLSYNRNIGINNASGEILSFPDDDCEYDVNTLEKIDELFITGNYDIISCDQQDRNSGKRILKVPGKAKLLTKENILYTVISISIFIKIKQKGDIFFDDRLGAGTYFGSGEETDMMLHLLGIGYSGYYSPYPYVFHITEDTNWGARRAYKYGLGFGALFKKEIFLRKNYRYSILFIHFLVRSIGGVFISKHPKYYLNSLAGRIAGFVKFKV